MADKTGKEQAATNDALLSSGLATGAGQLTQQGLEAMFPTSRPQQPTLPPAGRGIGLVPPSQAAPDTDWGSVLTGMFNTVAKIATTVATTLATTPFVGPVGGAAIGATAGEGVGKGLEVTEQKLDIGQPEAQPAQKPAQPMGQGQSLGRAKQLAQEHGARYNELAQAAFAQGAQSGQSAQGRMAPASPQPAISYSDAIGNLV